MVPLKEGLISLIPKYVPKKENYNLIAILKENYIISLKRLLRNWISHKIGIDKIFENL